MESFYKWAAALCRQLLAQQAASAVLQDWSDMIEFAAQGQHLGGIVLAEL